MFIYEMMYQFIQIQLYFENRPSPWVNTLESVFLVGGLCQYSLFVGGAGENQR